MWVILHYVSFASMLPDNRFKLLLDESDNNITIIGTHKVPLQCTNSYPMSLTVTQCHFILRTDYCQCHTISITNSQRRGRQLVSTAHPYVGPTIVWHTCEQANIIVFLCYNKT